MAQERNHGVHGTQQNVYRGKQIAYNATFMSTGQCYLQILLYYFPFQKKPGGGELQFSVKKVVEM